MLDNTDVFWPMLQSDLSARNKLQNKWLYQTLWFHRVYYQQGDNHRTATAACPICSSPPLEGQFVCMSHTSGTDKISPATFLTLCIWFNFFLRLIKLCKKVHFKLKDCIELSTQSTVCHCCGWRWSELLSVCEMYNYASQNLFDGCIQVLFYQ